MKFCATIADGEFIRVIDAAFGQQADALTVLQGSLLYDPVSDGETMKRMVAEWKADLARPAKRVRGTVVDATSGKAIAGAVVYTSDAIVRTDAAGAFQLQPRATQAKGLIWVEAEGYALCAYPALAGSAEPGDLRISLVKDEPIAGQVVGPDNRPVAGATIRACSSILNSSYRLTAANLRATPTASQSKSIRGRMAGTCCAECRAARKSPGSTFATRNM